MRHRLLCVATVRSNSPNTAISKLLLRLTDTILVCVVAAIGLLIPVSFLRVRTDLLKLRSTIDCLNRQIEAVNLVVDRQPLQTDRLDSLACKYALLG